MKRLTTLLIGVLLVPSILAATIHVPGDQPTIQAGIDVAVNGDTVLVANGTYTGAGNKNLDFGGKAITVQSEHGAASCIIDCENSGRGFYFHSGETSSSLISGLTIRNGNVNGFTPPDGGAIHCYNSSPRIESCEIVNNTTHLNRRGGGIYCEAGSSAIIKDCWLQDNVARYGAAISAYASDLTIFGCQITSNGSTLDGGGVFADGSSDPTISNCLIVGNHAIYGGGCYFENEALVENTTFHLNTAISSGGGLYCDSDTPLITNCILYGDTSHEIYGSPVVIYSNVQGMGGLDPLFVTGPLGDYYLSQTAAGQASDSPCVNEGSDPAGNICFGNPVICMDELTTRTDLILDSGQVDIGYHYPPVTPIPTVTPTPTPTETPTMTPTDTPTMTPTNTPSMTPTETPTPTYTEVPTVTPTLTPTDTPTMTPTATPEATSTPGSQDVPASSPIGIGMLLGIFGGLLAFLRRHK